MVALTAVLFYCSIGLGEAVLPGMFFFACVFDLVMAMFIGGWF